MPDIWVILPVIVSAAVILLLYTIPPPWVKRLLQPLSAIDLQEVTAPQNLGIALRHAYPPEDVAGMVNAIVEEQKPGIKSFIVDEGIPFLASVGSREVAANARGGKSQLASAVGELGSGAAGIQGLVAALAAPSKKSGVGDLMQYVPVIQSLMQQSKSQSNGPNEPVVSAPSNGGGSNDINWSAYR